MSETIQDRQERRRQREERLREQLRIDISPPPRKLSSSLRLSLMAPSTMALISCTVSLVFAFGMSYLSLWSKGADPADYFPQANWQPDGSATVHAVGEVSRVKKIVYTYAFSGKNNAGKDVAGNSYSESYAPYWVQGEEAPLLYSEKYNRYRLAKTSVESDGGADGWGFALFMCILIPAIYLFHFLRSFRTVRILENGEPADNRVTDLSDLQLGFRKLGQKFTCCFTDANGVPQRIRKWAYLEWYTENDLSLSQLLYDPNNPKRLFFLSKLPACDWPREGDGEVQLQSKKDVFYVYLRVFFAFILLLAPLGVLGLLFQFWTI